MLKKKVAPAPEKSAFPKPETWRYRAQNLFKQASNSTILSLRHFKYGRGHANAIFRRLGTPIFREREQLLFFSALLHDVESP
jgi:hypothetical protein